MSCRCICWETDSQWQIHFHVHAPDVVPNPLACHHQDSAPLCLAISSILLFCIMHTRIILAQTLNWLIFLWRKVIFGACSLPDFSLRSMFFWFWRFDLSHLISIAILRRLNLHPIQTYPCIMMSVKLHRSNRQNWNHTDQSRKFDKLQWPKWPFPSFL